MFSAELTDKIIGYIETRIIAGEASPLKKFCMNTALGIFRTKPDSLYSFIKGRVPELDTAIDIINLCRKEDGSFDHALLDEGLNNAISKFETMSIFGYDVGAAELQDIITYMHGS